MLITKTNIELFDKWFIKVLYCVLTVKQLIINVGLTKCTIYLMVLLLLNHSFIFL